MTKRPEAGGRRENRALTVGVRQTFPGGKGRPGPMHGAQARLTTPPKGLAVRQTDGSLAQWRTPQERVGGLPSLSLRFHTPPHTFPAGAVAPIVHFPTISLRFPPTVRKGGGHGQRQGTPRQRLAARHRRRRRTQPAQRPPRRTRPHRAEVRLRRGPVRRLHRPARRRPRPVLRCAHGHVADGQKVSRPSKGLGRRRHSFHPVQEAFLERYARFQWRLLHAGHGDVGRRPCSAASTPEPSFREGKEIVRFMDKNICRCGTYVRIVAAFVERRRGQADERRRAK